MRKAVVGFGQHVYKIRLIGDDQRVRSPVAAGL
jgi:hypothetical protein